MRAVSARLLPFLFVLYIANFLDRTNVAMAALQMNRDLRFSAAAYGFGAGVFFLGYALFEVPSNLILARVGARRWLARIMITWGLIAALLMFVRTPLEFYALRFALGLAEAGFFPGVVYYLGLWFPTRARARALARFAIAIPLSGALGNPLSASLLGLDGRLGLAGWQWLFLLEGIPSVVLGVAVLGWLTDRPEDARWLSAEQRAWLVARMARDHDESAAPHHAAPLRALAQPAVLIVTAAYLLHNVVAYVYIFWAPTLIRETLHTTPPATGWLLAAVACAAATGMLLNGASADRRGGHAVRAAAAIVAAACSYAGAALLPTPGARIAALALAYVALMSSFSPFWCLPGMLLRGRAAAAGIALVSSIGSVGGFVGPYAVGWLRDATGGTTGAFLGAAALALAGAALTFALRTVPAIAAWRPGVVAPAPGYAPAAGE
jgi:ACS family tartrate transporter-like MFS transporter